MSNVFPEIHFYTSINTSLSVLLILSHFSPINFNGRNMLFLIIYFECLTIIYYFSQLFP